MPIAIPNVFESSKSTTQSQEIDSHPVYLSDNFPVTSKRATLKAYVTGYSSSPEETDDTPFITARGTLVRDGIVATNMLPFGTKIRIPRVFGNKVFVVEDRMHSRFSDRVDVWFAEKGDAKRFGIQHAEIEVL